MMVIGAKHPLYGMCDTDIPYQPSDDDPYQPSDDDKGSTSIICHD